MTSVRRRNNLWIKGVGVCQKRLLLNSPVLPPKKKQKKTKHYIVSEISKKL